MREEVVVAYFEVLSQQSPLGVEKHGITSGWRVVKLARLRYEVPDGDMIVNPVNFAWFRVSAAKYMRSVLFWAITQRIVIFPYRRFVTTYRYNLQGSRIQASWSLKMGPISCPETSVRSYHHTGRNGPEECRFLSVFFTEVLISPLPDLLPDVFCLMVRIFRLMLVLLYIYKSY